MARVPYGDLEALAPEVRAQVRMFGDLNIDRMLAQARTVVGPLHETTRSILAESTLDPRLRELVILLVAHSGRCAYEAVQHEVSARAVGVTQAQLDALEADDPSAAVFTDAEKAVLRLVAAALHDSADVPEETFDRAHDHLGDRGTVELMILVALYSGMAILLNTLQVDIDATARMRFAPNGNGH
ncbi:carboxymuconolactone decarboxylase family protein [Nocardia sp. CDC159]|uniref:Carboxymuconolactone decarboxylase family protein n=1 Tax=Nocardia pulmonis TaxID=2951408 RepID=A0A9X2EHB8_9NOCA|nr:MULTISPECIES: carboxymuconolactone decarboxylase family protein [Nocardia]MCM6778243.1 carboxymuconolactone decarboxylase family protein [Nocardia pulmonis]MCM6791132.1 carboxymuconolactone decarboxylase family protein [Nocardia sp. CDC159]